MPANDSGFDTYIALRFEMEQNLAVAGGPNLDLINHVKCSDIPNPQLPLELYPRALYRVHFSHGSYTSYKSNLGFRCTKAGYINLQNYGELAYGIRNHLRWQPKPSSFISTFVSRKHALNWARKRLRQGKYGRAYIMKIDPREITNAEGGLLPILKLSDVIEDYPGILRGVDKERIRNEYLALYIIPASAILYVSRVK
ncbi:hypothetical protein TWF730_007224 [Orbilia blumenaviensis]|uniref:DUF7587 domain-containing protein n=1 Tax=Orbilia blumenaviensis TaxID=1796055 RepID=A0AAV9V7D0_9PEZI